MATYDKKDVITAKESLRHLKNFLTLSSGPVTSRSSKTSNWASLSLKDLTESPIYLVKNVPVSKTSVLDYFGLLVFEQMSYHMRQVENPASCIEAGYLEEAAILLAGTIQNLVNDGSVPWTLLTFQWTLDTLAELPRRFPNRRSVSGSSLTDSLKLYSGNKATKAVLDLLSCCVSKLLNSSPEKCVTALLDASAKYGVYFDWILTYVSIIYPKVIISHLLCCGLSDFSAYVVDLSSRLSILPVNQIIQRCEQYTRDKLVSLASILSQLAAQQSKELASCFRKLFEEAIHTDSSTKQQCGVAFLFKISMFSREISEILIADLGEYATVPILIKIMELFHRIPAQILLPDQNIHSAIVNIFSSLDQSNRCVNFILDKLYHLAFENYCIPSSSGDWTVRLQKGSLAILEMLLDDMERSIHSRYATSLDRLPILGRILEDLEDAVHRMLFSGPHQSGYYFKLLVLCCLVKGVETSAFILALVLIDSENDKQLAAFVDLATIVAPFQPSIFEHFVVKLRHYLTQARCLESSLPMEKITRNKDSFWLTNLLRLLQWEQNLDGNRSCFILDLFNAVGNNYFAFIDQLIPYCFAVEQLDEKMISMGHVSLEILFLVGPPAQLLIAETYRIVSFYVRLLLMHLSQVFDDITMDTFCLSVELAFTFLTSQASLVTEAFFKLFLHNLLSDDQWKRILGPNLEEQTDSTIFEEFSSEDSLLTENRKLNTSHVTPSSLIHSGVIKDRRFKGRFESDTHICDPSKKLLLLKFVSRLCSTNKALISRHSSPGAVHPNTCNIETCRQIAVRLNEYLCPDAIASEHAWDDWDYAKSNIERLLIISKRVNDVPFVWELLYIISEGYPTLWYSLPLLKSVLASIMIKLETSPDKYAKPLPQLLSPLKKWFAVASKGALLTQPMGYLYDIVERVNNYESFVILLQLWKYLHAIWPNLTILNQHFDCFQLQFENQLEVIKGDPLPFLEPLQRIMQANIRTVGFLYSKIFKIKL